MPNDQYFIFLKSVFKRTINMEKIISKLTTKNGKKVHYAFAILLMIGFVLGFVAAYWC